MIIINYPPHDSNSDTCTELTTLPESYGYVVRVDADIDCKSPVLKPVKKEPHYIKFKNNFSKLKKYQKI